MKITKENLYAAIEYRGRLYVAMEIVGTAAGYPFSNIGEDAVATLFYHYSKLSRAIAVYNDTDN